MIKIKKKLATVVKGVINGAAVMSSESTSWLGLYQPKTPKALLESKKRKVK